MHEFVRNRFRAAHGTTSIVSRMRRQLVIGLAIAAFGCSGKEKSTPLFRLLPPEATGVDFVNAVVEQEGFNVLEYEYFYNGAGVAAGDLTGDGLPELYFTANMEPDVLYLNEGEFRFVDVSARAGLVQDRSWTTGVTMVDINDDGWLDIYVCKSGNVSAGRRRNLLYVNNGDLTFTERAADYGLDLATYSNHASFFDYDRDGDLDVYVLNHSIRRYSRFLVDYMRNQRDSLAGDLLLRNDGGRFVDVSEEAGIIGNPLGFGLSAIVSDINKDGWLDIYVSNDYIEDDYLYINVGDGTFRESVREYLTHASYSSMGADIADINNDLLPDIYTLDMLAEDNYRQKILKGPEDHVFYAKLRQDGFFEQYMRNMLHVARPAGGYVEIGQMAGVSNTDWSWAAILADLDLDGYKDALVTNGYMRDYTNLDFLNTTLVKAYADASARGEVLSSLEMVQQMPETRLRNYVYRNEGNLTFSDRTSEWGLGQLTLSNGAVVSDLDGDAYPDIAISNINAPAMLYRNEAGIAAANRALVIRLEGPPGNRWGIGSKVMVRGGDLQLYQELVPGRGYLSSLSPELNFGLGTAESVEVEVLWPDGSAQVVPGVTSSLLTLRHADAQSREPVERMPEETLFARANHPGLDFAHREDGFVDFDREPLLPHMLSREGPALAAGDINGDGLDDIFFGGARGQAGRLLLQQASGEFLDVRSQALDAHAAFEDTDAAMFDFDGDGDLDLYVASGGGAFDDTSAAYQDRLYVNAGFGNLAYAAGALPDMPHPSSTVAPQDFDADGDIDLFVGGRWRPGIYPHPPRSYLLQNTGSGFVDVTQQVARDLAFAGLVTDAAWTDITGDAEAELVVVGDWMPVRVFSFEQADGAVEVSASLGLAGTSGFWNTVVAADLDGDGDHDLVAGNSGLNTQIRISAAEPATAYSHDFDSNGSMDFVMGHYIQGRLFPVAARDELVAQMPRFAERFPTYASYARAEMNTVLLSEERAAALELQAGVAETSVFENVDRSRLERRPLPLPAQVSETRSVLVGDFDGQGVLDLLLAGNDYGNRAQYGRRSAGSGTLLLGRGRLTYSASQSSGFVVPGDTRRLLAVETGAGKLILAANNDGPLTTFTVK